MAGTLSTVCLLFSWLAASLQSSDQRKAEVIFHSCLNRYLETINSEPVSRQGYTLGFADLNEDGILDAVALMGGGTEWVGSGGAALFVFQGEGRGFSFTGMSTQAGAPILAREGGGNWLDIVVHSSGGGYPSGYRLLIFDGEDYPLNSSLQPETDLFETDTVIIPGG